MTILVLSFSGPAGVTVSRKYKRNKRSSPAAKLGSILL